MILLVQQIAKMSTVLQSNIIFSAFPPTCVVVLKTLGHYVIITLVCRGWLFSFRPSVCLSVRPSVFLPMCLSVWTKAGKNCRT